MLERLGRAWTMVPSHEGNEFTPAIADYLNGGGASRSLMLLSNPCNPTGITRRGAELRALVEAASTSNTGLLIDEAYELFQDRPESALQYVNDIDASNLFVVGAATKGLQAPGIRIGWAIASKANIEILGNFSSFGMGGVSHPSQRYALELLEPARTALVRAAVPAFYRSQRDRYGDAFTKLGLKLYTGDGGFYHWCRLSPGLTAEALNQRLFKDGAAILKGTDCDMARRGDASPLRNFFRFSFGPLAPDSFDEDVAILRRALHG
jgi:aspartate/methionine/tyrosine aminotransferase